MHSTFDRAMRCYLFAQMQQKGYSLLSRSLCSVYLFSTFSIQYGLHPWLIKLNPFRLHFNIPVHLPINLKVLPLPHIEGTRVRLLLPVLPGESTRVRPYKSFKCICKSASVFINTSLTLLPWLGPTIPAASN